MKKVIDRKVYDTETATELATWWNGYGGDGGGDFKNCSETLYQSKKGSFFLHGEGGPMSSYARPCGNGLSGGSDIKPFTKEEAIRWLERRELVYELVTIFGEDIEEA
jgi:hypothetical protein